MPPDTQALEQVYRDEAVAIWRTLVAFTGGRKEIAEDALGEAFARALVHLDSIRDVRAWLYKTALRLAAKELRRERTAAETGVVPAAEDDRDDEVMAALSSLPPKQRAAIVMHYYVDMPVRDIAQALGVSVPTVKVHLFRGRTRLRLLLGSEKEQ
jgi:RNA polymerase sigma factor (sigma-70 family)